VTIRGEDWQISSRAMAEMENEASLKKEQKEVEMSSLKGKVEVMNIFIKGIKKIGITPESVFRVADFAYKTYVESDYFREVLSKMKLGLTPKEISCLIFIFDEACSGFITREDYANSLHAYKVGVETSNQQYVQECVFRLAQMLHQDKVNLVKFYEEMEGKSKSKVGSKKVIDLNLFEEQLKKHYPAKVTEREIVAAFNAIDLESEGYLEKSNFLYCITSCINKLLSGEDSLSRKSQAEWNPNAKSRMTEPFVDTVKTSPKKGEKAVDAFNSGSKLAVIGEASGHTPNFGALSKLESEYSTSIYSIYE
jgi:Ca2+-binding EF-hand superfamily protein